MSQNPTREEVFAALRSLSDVVPEMRAGQLAAAVGEVCADLHGRGLWEATDAELLEAVWQFRRDLESSAAGRGRQAAEQTAATDRRGIAALQP
jgi:hypothetical protein